MKRMRLLIVVAIGALGAAAAGAYWHWGPEEAGAAGPVTVHGNVEMRQAELAFEVSGRLASLRVTEGDRVTAGQTLAALERRRYRRALAEAEARVAAQRQQVLELTRGTRPQAIRRARAAVAAARAERDNARSQLERLRGLESEQYVSPQRLDDAETTLKAAQARLRGAREELALAEAGPRSERIGAARARLEALEAARDRKREDLADTTLEAPVAGVVRNRLMEPGEVTSPGSPVLTLARRDRIWIRAFLPEPQLSRVQPGSAAVIRSNAFPGRTLPARVGHISPTAEFTPKTVQTTEVRPDLVYRIRINACEPFEALRLGMPVTVEIRPGAPSGPACP